MLDLSHLEMGRLRMSVGYGTQKKGRPFSPIEVALYFDKAINRGLSFKDIAKAVSIDETNVRRFLNLLNLPEKIRHLVSWADKNSISFSSAVEISKIVDSNDKLIVANSILEDGINSKEVGQIAQLQKRSKKNIRECIKEILGMRPTIEKRYVFIGSIIDQSIIRKLSQINQAEKDSILNQCLKALNINDATGHLGVQFFTLVGNEHFNNSMNNLGKESLEQKIQFQIAEGIRLL